MSILKLHKEYSLSKYITSSVHSLRVLPLRCIAVSHIGSGGAGNGSVSCWRTFGEDERLLMDTH